MRYWKAKAKRDRDVYSAAPPPVALAEVTVSFHLFRDAEHWIRTVDELAAVVNDALDLTLLLQVPDCYPRQGAVDLQPLDEDGLADEAEGRDLLEDTVVGRLVEDNGVLRLVLDLALGPLLLLGSLAAARRCGCCLSLGLEIVQYQHPLVTSKGDASHPGSKNTSTTPSTVEHVVSVSLGLS